MLWVSTMSNRWDLDNVIKVDVDVDDNNDDVVKGGVR